MKLAEIFNPVSLAIDIAIDKGYEILKTNYDTEIAKENTPVVPLYIVSNIFFEPQPTREIAAETGRPWTQQEIYAYAVELSKKTGRPLDEVLVEVKESEAERVDRLNQKIQDDHRKMKLLNSDVSDMLKPLNNV